MKWRPSLPIEMAAFRYHSGKEAGAGRPSHALRQGGLRQGQMKTAFSVIEKFFVASDLATGHLAERSGATLRKPPCWSVSGSRHVIR